MDSNTNVEWPKEVASMFLTLLVVAYLSNRSARRRRRPFCCRKPRYDMMNDTEIKHSTNASQAQKKRFGNLKERQRLPPHVSGSSFKVVAALLRLKVLVQKRTW